MKHGGRLDLYPAQGISDILSVQNCCFRRPSILYNLKLLRTFSPQITSQPRYGIVATSLDGIIHASGGNVGADTGEWRHFRQKYLLYSYLTAICLFFICFGQIKFRQTFCITGPETQPIHIKCYSFVHSQINWYVLHAIQMYNTQETSYPGMLYQRCGWRYIIFIYSNYIINFHNLDL